MDFNANRGNRQPQPTSSPASPQTPGASGASNGPKSASSGAGVKNKVFNLKFASIALLFSATILVVALLFYLVVGMPKNESGFVENDKYQAVFLNGGQVYFGQVTDLNNKYLRLVDIYYLRVDQQVQPAEDGQVPDVGEGDISLVKLGCELHGPKDEMLINRDQMVFWENLKDDGQVTEAILAYKAENPDGQDCEVPDQGGVPQQPVPGTEQEDDDTEE